MILFPQRSRAGQQVLHKFTHRKQRRLITKLQYVTMLVQENTGSLFMSLGNFKLKQ